MGKPETVFKAGSVRASIFVNTIDRDGQTIPIRKVVIEVRYRDKSGQWQGTNSLSLNEVPKAITALQQAYEHILNQGSQAADVRMHEAPAHTDPGLSGSANAPWPRSPTATGYKI